MSLTPGHEELQEMLPAAALEILEATEMEQLLIHVRECPECTKLLEEYREAAAAVSLHLPGRRLDPARAQAMRTRLLVRAMGQTGGTTGVRADRQTGGQVGRPGRRRLDRWLGLAVAAGLSGILLIHHSVHVPLDYGWLAAGVLLLVLVGVGIYARVQRRRMTELEDRLAGSDPKNPAL